MTLIVFLKFFLEKVSFEKSQQTTTKDENYPACKEIIEEFPIIRFYQVKSNNGKGVYCS